MTQKPFLKAVLKPKLLTGLEAAFTLVEKMNEERYDMLEERRSSDRRHRLIPKSKVCAVVICSTRSWKNLLCFCGDEDVEQQVYGNVILAKKRYVLPVTYIDSFVNLVTFYSGYVSELEKIYNFRFSPQPVSDDFSKEVNRERSDEEVLGFALYRILGDGRGFIPREQSTIGWENAKDDKPFKILCEKAQKWMDDNKFDPYPSN
jgi:hypothetical protein